MATRKVSSEPRKCQVEGCEGRKYYALGFCHKHWRCFNKYGEIKRTAYEFNTFSSDENVTRMDLFDKHGTLVCSAFIDTKDVPLVVGRKWHKNNEGYVANTDRKTRKDIRLHRMIMGANEGEEVDHIDGNPLNNRRSNLRICSHGQNQCNAKVPRNNTSGIKNVSWNAEVKKWSVYVGANGIKHHIGRFKNLEDAKRAAEVARTNFHGEFANHG